VETYEVNVVTCAVFGNCEQVNHPDEAREARELRRHLVEGEQIDRVYLDLSLIHLVAIADFDVRACPDPHAKGDGAVTNALSKSLGEEHFGHTTAGIAHARIERDRFLAEGASGPAHPPKYDGVVAPVIVVAERQCGPRFRSA
jgi:hypothetical protein